jgi:hypothetical protein
LSFVVYLAILCAVAALVWFTQETVRHPEPGQIAPAVTGFGLMALVGFYAALMPSILLQVVNQSAPAGERAAVVSIYFVCCFIGNALPVIRVGVLSSLISTTVVDVAFACMIAALAAVALIFGIIYHRWTRRGPKSFIPAAEIASPSFT